MRTLPPSPRAAPPGNREAAGRAYRWASLPRATTLGVSSPACTPRASQPTGGVRASSEVPAPTDPTGSDPSGGPSRPGRRAQIRGGHPDRAARRLRPSETAQRSPWTPTLRSTVPRLETGARIPRRTPLPGPSAPGLLGSWARSRPGPRAANLLAPRAPNLPAPPGQPRTPPPTPHLARSPPSPQPPAQLLRKPPPGLKFSVDRPGPGPGCSSRRGRCGFPGRGSGRGPCRRGG